MAKSALKFIEKILANKNIKIQKKKIKGKQLVSYLVTNIFLK